MSSAVLHTCDVTLVVHTGLSHYVVTQPQIRTVKRISPVCTNEKGNNVKACFHVVFKVS